MSKLLWITALALLSHVSARAQEVVWAKQITQPAVGYGVIPAAGGGFMVVGHLAPLYDGLFVRLDGQGDTLWSKRIPYPNGIHFLGVFQQGDSGYIAYGRPRSRGQDHGVHLVCIDTAGNLRWQKSVSTGSEYISGARGTADGGIVTTATYGLPSPSTSKSYEVVRIAADGAVLWERRLVLPSGSGTWGIRQLRDGGYAMVTSSANTGADFAVTRLGPAGDSIWSYRYELPGHQFMVDLAETDDGQIVVAGRSGDGEQAAFVVWLTGSGQLVRHSGYSELRDVWQIERRGSGFVVGGALSWDNREGLLFLDEGGVVQSFLRGAEIWGTQSAYVRHFMPLADGRVVCTGEFSGRMLAALVQGPVSAVRQKSEPPTVLDLW